MAKAIVEESGMKVVVKWWQSHSKEELTAWAMVFLWLYVGQGLVTGNWSVF